MPRLPVLWSPPALCGEAAFDDRERLLGLLARAEGDEAHAPSATSTLDVLWVLYDRVLDVAPEREEDPLRDRFVLSKGHGPAAYYAVLAAKGYIDPSELEEMGTSGSRLGLHPDRRLVPGIEVSSGSLGHGLPLAVGIALGLRALDQLGPRVVCLLGDAELDEGSNAEAIAIAARLGLSRLTAIVVDNQSATHGWPGGIAERFRVEGWRAVTVDGRDHAALADALTDRAETGPDVVVAVVEAKW